MSISEIIVSILLFFGVSFSLLSAIGLIRLPDVYTRSHAISKSSNLGIFCTLMATFLFFLFTEEYISVRLFLGIMFVFLTLLFNEFEFPFPEANIVPGSIPYIDNLLAI